MATGSAWVVTGWTVVGSTVFLFGFLFFYDITPYSPPSTPAPITTTRPNTPSSTDMTSPLMTAISTTGASVTTAEMTTTGSSFGQCGTTSGKLDGRLAEPVLGPFLVGLLKGRIIGGITAVDGEWPWVVYLYEIDNGIENGGICGGTLVSDRWVVTAAHCIGTNLPSIYGVVLGEHTISLSSGREVLRGVSQIVMHPLFDSVSFNFDIALLELDEPVTFSEFVRPSCLVSNETRTDDDDAPTFAGSICSTLGWGLTSSPGGQRSDTLMQLNLVVSPFTICSLSTLTGGIDYGNRPVSLGDPKFCAGGTLGEDSCNGDSGGPLVCLHDDGIYYLHGITSYGTNVCAQANKPGVYTKYRYPFESVNRPWASAKEITGGHAPPVKINLEWSKNGTFWFFRSQQTLRNGFFSSGTEDLEKRLCSKELRNVGTPIRTSLAYKSGTVFLLQLRKVTQKNNV